MSGPDSPPPPRGVVGTIRRLVELGGLARSDLGLLTFCIVATHLTMLPYPLAVKYILDVLVPSGSAGALGLICLALVLFLFGHVASLWLLEFVRVQLIVRTAVPLYRRVLRGIAELPVDRLRTSRVGFWTAKVRDCFGFGFLLSSNALPVVDLTVGIVTSVPFMLWLSPSLTLVALAAAPVGVLLFRKSLRDARELAADQLHVGDTNSAWCREVVMKHELVQGYTIGRDLRRLQRHRAAAFTRFLMGPHLRAKERFMGAEAALTFIQVAILWWGLVLLANGSLSVGSFLAFMAISQRLSESLVQLPQTAWSLTGALAVVDRLEGSLQVADEGLAHRARAEAARTSTRRLVLEGRLRFDAVTFGYDPAAPVLREVSFDLAPGEHVGIHGPSGTGKSTLASLAAGLYVPQSGQILIDGHPLEAWGRAYTQRLGLIFQSYKLFPGTIRDNLSIMDPGATDGDMWEALERALAAEFVRARAGGLDAPVGFWGGSNFSLGQRQRLLMAAMFVRRPRVCILDEATSALDVRNEGQLLDNLMEFLQGRTTIFISHRLAALARVGRILCMESGRIVGDGPPSAMLEAGASARRGVVMPAGAA